MTSFKQIVREERNSKQNYDGDIFKSALNGKRAAVKKAGGKSKVGSPSRILPVPSKLGEFLRLLSSILAGVSAIGSSAGGVLYCWYCRSCQ